MNIFFDTETTGLKEPRLVELAYSIDGRPIQSFRCKPPKDIELDATVINGIRNKDVEMLQPFNEMACYQEIKELFENNTMVAHNAVFDVGVMANEGIFIQDFICTKNMARTVFPDAPSHRLQHLRYWLDLDVEGQPHSATGDVVVLMALYDAMAMKEEG